jgi:signal transduction histidine kinase
MRTSLAPGRPALVAGLLYVLAYLIVTALLPRPASAGTRILLCALWLTPPAVLALLATARRARSAQGAERVLWAFVCAASILQTFSVGLFFARGLETPPSALASGFRMLAHHGSFVLLAAGLLARPDRPREARELRAAAHQALSLTLCAAFLVAYFVILAPRVSLGATFLLYSAEDLVLALLAFVLAGRVAPPDKAPYRLLAVGLALAAAFALPGNWRNATGSYQHYGPLDVAWMIPSWTLVAAAASARVPWVSASESRPAPVRDRVAAAALVFPALVDLLARVLGLPGDEAARTLLALSTLAVLALISGLRLRADLGEPALAPYEPSALPGSPELLRLASGTAHELNNPLMAVVVASELAVARGGPEPPLRALQEAVHDAAASVRRFQLVASGQGALPRASP